MTNGQPTILDPTILQKASWMATKPILYTQKTLHPAKCLLLRRESSYNRFAGYSPSLFHFLFHLLNGLIFIQNHLFHTFDAVPFGNRVLI